MYTKRDLDKDQAEYASASKEMDAKETGPRTLEEAKAEARKAGKSSCHWGGKTYKVDGGSMSQ